jgi:hypothetical protein
MLIFTAQYYRLWGLLLFAFPIISDFGDYCCLHSGWSQHDSLLLPPTRATRKRRTNKLGRCYQLERPFCTLSRYTLRRRTATFTYMWFSAQASGRETRVHAGRWHAGRSLRPRGHWGQHCITVLSLVFLLLIRASFLYFRSLSCLLPSSAF